MGRRESLITHLTMSFVGHCRAGDLEGVRAALQRGANVNTKSDYGLTGLMHAVRHNCNSVVALLLKIPNIDVNQRDDYRRCALHWAVTKENNEALKLLLNAPEVDVNIVDNSRKSVLVPAVLADNIEALKLLLNVPNIDVNIVDSEGLSALHRAVNSANWKMLFNLPNINVNIALLQLCEKGDLEGVKTALQRGRALSSSSRRTRRSPSCLIRPHQAHR